MTVAGHLEKGTGDAAWHAAWAIIYLKLVIFEDLKSFIFDHGSCSHSAYACIFKEPFHQRSETLEHSTMTLVVGSF